MVAVPMLRAGVAALALGGVALLGFSTAAPDARGQATFVQDGRAGFVVTNWSFALAPDAQETGACPNGWTTGLREQYANRVEGARREGESDADYQRRQFAAFQSVGRGPNGEDPCLNPEAVGPNAGWRTVDVPNARAFGIDLDGQNSTVNGRPARGTCAHNDFRGFHGERGIDNQFFRVVGCSRSYQPGGQSWDNTIELRTGSWGVLIALDGVDDIRNDNEVTVNFAAAADPIQLSANREPYPNATYAMMQNARYRATTHGRIVNGVLTSDPVDVRFFKVTAGMYSERPLRHARLQATLSEEGVLDGILAGYAPVDAIYDHQYGFRSATGSPGGSLASVRGRSGTANGNAGVNNHTCNGAYFALWAAADGDPDETGRCTSISTQYHIRAIPAFVVDVATSSSNAALDRGSGPGF